MAREIKEALDYFPLDTDFYTNRKVRRLLHAQGSKGLAVWVVMLAMIYGDKGYYTVWDDNTCFDLSYTLGISESATKEIIKYCTVISLLDKEQLEKNHILTSKGIQDQYEKIIGDLKRKNEIDPKFRVNGGNLSISSEETRVNSEETRVNSELMQQSKVKESKVKESKVKKSKVKESADMRDTNITKQGRNSASVSKSPLPSQTDNDYGKVSRFYQENFGMLSAYLAQDLEYEVSDMGADLVIEAMKRALVNNKNYSYARNILRNWRQKGVKTLEDAEAETVAFKKSKQATQGKKRLRRQEQIPDWLDDYQQQGGSVPKNKTEKEPADSDDDSLDDLKAMRESWKQMLNSDKSNDKANDKSKEKINDG